MTFTSEKIGLECERMVVEICESLSYYVWKPPRGNPNWDLLVNGRRVEVKKRHTRPSRPSLSFELSTAKRQTNVACTTKDVDVFVVLIDGSWFVFPSAVVALPNGDIPNRIRVRDFAHYRDAWSVLAGEVRVCERQLGFGF